MDTYETIKTLRPGDIILRRRNSRYLWVILSNDKDAEKLCVAYYSVDRKYWSALFNKPYMYVLFTEGIYIGNCLVDQTDINHLLSELTRKKMIYG